jgi:hypothetical protein
VECDRHWHPGEGVPTAYTDRFSIRERSFGEPHAPLTIGGLENPLHVIKGSLKQLSRLMILLRLREIDERTWAQVIRRQYGPPRGRVPPRRLIGDPDLKSR